MWAWRYREDVLNICEQVTGNRNHYGMMKPGGVRRDVLAFEELSRSDDLAELDRAENLYRGELLAGIGVRDSAFEEWLETHYPDRRERVLSRLRAMRGGELYDSRFGKRQTGEGEEARLIAQRFQAACKRLSLQPNRQAWALTSDLFKPPAADARQLPLL